MSKLHDILGNGYKVIRGYLPKEEALELGKEFLNSAKEDGYGNHAEKFVSNCQSEYNYPSHAAVLAEKTSHLNEILGEKVVPSYCFSRVYYGGSSLPKHTDRESCEVSLSINLYSDKEWSFYVGGDEIILEPGDAVLYDGPNAEHWREEYDGEFYVQSFHHYVFLKGKHSNLVFDRDRAELDLKNYIKVYNNFVPDSLCDEIIEYIEKPQLADRWAPAQVTDYTEGVRVCNSFNFLSEDPLDSKIYDYVVKATQKYASTFPYFNIKNDAGYTALKYIPGGKFEYHTDQCDEYNRAVTMIINLNDDYSGGRLEFFDNLHHVDMKKGDVIVFPSSFTFPHSITPLTDGTRYSIVTWLV